MKLKKYDVVIIGAGPAGLSAAETLAKAGKSVVVFEKNKIIGKKACGGGITPHKYKSINIPKTLIEREFWQFEIGYKNKTVDIEATSAPLVATLDRIKLGHWMAEEAKKQGAFIKTKSKVEKINKNSVVIGGKEVKFDYLIGADGSNSIIRKYLGLKTNRMNIIYHCKINKKFKKIGFYADFDSFGFRGVYIFPHKNCTYLGAGGNINYKGMGNLKIEFCEWLRQRGINILKSKLRADIINFDYQGHEFGNIFLVGDAAGFASGLDGEGIYGAIVSGKEIAKKIINPSYGCTELKKLLKWKRFHEKYLIKSNKPLNKIGMLFFMFLIRSKIIYLPFRFGLMKKERML